MSRSEIESRAEDFASLSEGYLQAWDAHDVEALRSFYADEVAIDWRAGGFYLYQQGLEAMMLRVEGLFAGEPDIRYEPSPHFSNGLIGGDGGIASLIAFGEGRFTEEEPVFEADQISLRDGLIADSYLMVNNQAFRTRNEVRLTPHNRILAYGEAWTSGDVSQVLALYDSAAVREDAILGVRAEGIEALESVVTDFFADHPGAEWAAQLTLGSLSAECGMFRVTDAEGCTVGIAVVVRYGNDKIIDEELYYDADSLLACGWVG